MIVATKVILEQNMWKSRHDIHTLIRALHIASNRKADPASHLHLDHLTISSWSFLHIHDDDCLQSLSRMHHGQFVNGPIYSGVARTNINSDSVADGRKRTAFLVFLGNR